MTTLFREATVATALMLALGGSCEARAEPWPSTDFDCLAANIYHEARGESLYGQIAVAQVTLNRVEDERWPDTICGVVKQKHQFSWYWDGKPDRPTDDKAWDIAQRIAVSLWLRKEIQGELFIGDSTHYLNPDKVEQMPAWTDRMEKTLKVGKHQFYM